MSKFYQAMPISDWQNGDAFRYLEASGRNPIDRRITTKYIEAEVYRKIFRASVESRVLQSTQYDRDYESELAFFSEKNQATIFQHLLMLDFYRNEATFLKAAFEKMGGDHRRARGLIDGAVSKKLILKETLPEDNRQYILFPTIRMISAYERRLAQLLWDIEKRQGNDPVKHYEIEEFFKFDALRQKHLPSDLSNQISVQLVNFKDSLLQD